MKVAWKFDIGQDAKFFLSRIFKNSFERFHLKNRKSLFPFRFYIATEFSLLYITHAYIADNWIFFAASQANDNKD